MFSNAIQHIMSGNHSGPIDEDDAINAHQQVYSQDNSGGGLNSGAIGSAAALQALKSFVSGQGNDYIFQASFC